MLKFKKNLLPFVIAFVVTSLLLKEKYVDGYYIASVLNKYALL